tara:strand:+ start:625 stop:741 length:117 start_codon:yes stop_codon:yes gene_type:complete
MRKFIEDLLRLLGLLKEKPKPKAKKKPKKKTKKTTKKN